MTLEYHKAISYYKTNTDKYWFHELIIETDKGKVLIEDDTDEVNVTATSRDVSVEDAYFLWDYYSVGTSIFPNNAPDAINNRYPHLMNEFVCGIWHGEGDRWPQSDKEQDKCGDWILTLHYKDTPRSEIEHIAEDCIKNGDYSAVEYEIEAL